MVNASKYLEYDRDSDDLVHHHNKPQFMTSEKNWLLKYQQLVQFYLPVLLYQRNKFKSDPDTFDSHRVMLIERRQADAGRLSKSTWQTAVQTQT
jgi:hypothetical protein